MSQRPRNCLILGSGRSGTSLVAGLLAHSGYFMGDAPVGPGRPVNPKGLFEDPEINAINEKLIKRAIRRYRRNPLNWLLHRQRWRELAVGTTQRWLAPLPTGEQIRVSPRIEKQIQALTSHEPFCFKDPRFSFTLQAWRQLAINPLLICVFRHPAITAASIVAHARYAPYLRDLQMDLPRAQRVWESTYRSVLKIQRPKGGDWLFLHYDQVMNGSAFPALERSLGILVDREFPDSELRRSKPEGTVSPQAQALYQQLCNLAGHAE